MVLKHGKVDFNACRFYLVIPLRLWGIYRLTQRQHSNQLPTLSSLVWLVMLFMPDISKYGIRYLRLLKIRSLIFLFVKGYSFYNAYIQSALNKINLW